MKRLAVSYTMRARNTVQQQLEATGHVLHRDLGKTILQTNKLFWAKRTKSYFETRATRQMSATMLPKQRNNSLGDER